MSTESKGAGLFEREFGPADHHVFASLADIRVLISQGFGLA